MSLYFHSYLHPLKEWWGRRERRMREKLRDGNDGIQRVKMESSLLRFQQTFFPSITSFLHLLTLSMLLTQRIWNAAGSNGFNQTMTILTLLFFLSPSEFFPLSLPRIVLWHGRNSLKKNWKGQSRGRERWYCYWYFTMPFFLLCWLLVCFPWPFLLSSSSFLSLSFFLLFHFSFPLFWFLLHHHDADRLALFGWRGFFLPGKKTGKL